MALLDFQVMGAVKSITAIDTDEGALSEVERRIDEELAANHGDAGKITTVRKDVFELTDERWDIVLLSFFADSPEKAERMLTLAKHRGVVVMHANESGGLFGPVSTDKPRATVKEMEGHLIAKGYGYRKNIVDLQFGQPFRTIEDIHEFIRGKSGEGRDAYDVEERIIKTKRYDYPYYLPGNLRAAIFIINKGN
jgi:hypothetical protein